MYCPLNTLFLSSVLGFTCMGPDFQNEPEREALHLLRQHRAKATATVELKFTFLPPNLGSSTWQRGGQGPVTSLCPAQGRPDVVNAHWRANYIGLRPCLAAVKLVPMIKNWDIKKSVLSVCCVCGGGEGSRKSGPTGPSFLLDPPHSGHEFSLQATQAHSLPAHHR